MESFCSRMQIIFGKILSAGAHEGMGVVARGGTYGV